jgi:hypothetical protein
MMDETKINKEIVSVLNYIEAAKLKRTNGTRRLLGGKRHTKKRRSSSIKRKHRNRSSRVRK